MKHVRRSIRASNRKRLNRQLERLARAETRAHLAHLRAVRREAEVVSGVIRLIVYAIMIASMSFMIYTILAASDATLCVLKFCF